MRFEKGVLRLFGILGIEVFLHWSWAVVAAIEIGTRKNAYTTQVWNIAEYLALFVIVLMHEFGHALACRSVGGKAERIVLWPLGGVAYVAPPPRPGAVLWSIAAGPLVNVVLLPVTLVAWFVADAATGEKGDAYQLVCAILGINLVLLVYNILPFYPLDGGQIVRALLWFFIGPTRSLRVACILGLCGAAALLVASFFMGSTWIAVLAAYGALRAYQGYRLASAPRREGVACPSCHAAPPIAPVWICRCGNRFDAFAVSLEGAGPGGVCTKCGAISDRLACPECQQLSPIAAWHRG